MSPWQTVAWKARRAMRAGCPTAYLATVCEQAEASDYRVSVATNGTEANDYSFLVGADTNGVTDVFLRARTTNMTSRVSHLLMDHTRFFVNICRLVSTLSLHGEFATVPATIVPARLFVHVVEPMLKRLLAVFSPDTTSNKLLRLDWIEALQMPGCALCHLGQRKSQRYVETLLHEAVIDVGQRDIWREARGLCHWHAWMAMETPHSAGSLAILYGDVLRHDLEHLAALTAATPATRRRRAQRSLAQRLQDWLRAWRQQRPCPVCHLWREQERLYLHVLLDDWQELELARAFAASSGLCWSHTLRLVQ
jgi:hypothetical protein